MDCKACGASNPDGFRFCGGCGTALVSLTPPPSSLTAKGIASRSSLEGERKLITTLSADVQGSMDLIEQTDPEHWHSAMDGLFKLLCAGIHRFEGTVQQFTGDGVLALFGAPIAHEDHARRACYAALHISEAIDAYAVELRRTHGLNFHVRIGVHSGEVIVGTIGDDLDMQYTAIGHAVGLAHRIQTLAAPGTPYITDVTAALVEGHFRLADLGTFAVKGVKDEVRVFAVEGAVGPRAAIEIARHRGFSSFVGRAEEMARLEAALARATDGNGQAIGVVGEPGVGKSRLCVEFAERCEAKGIAVWRTHGVSHGRAIPFLPVLQLLRGYFGVQEDDRPEQVRERIAGRQVLLAPGFEADLPLLFDFLGVTDADRPAPPLAADVRMRRILAVVDALMRGRSQRRAAIILLDDLQWFDDASLTFFEHVIDFARDSRTIVLANFRPELAWDLERLHLQPLEAMAVGELVAAVAGNDETLAGLAEYMLDRTGGNPFFIEELIRAMVESGALQGAPRAYRLVQPLAQLEVPATVQAVLAARIDRLSVDEKTTLQVASAIGRTFTLPLLLYAGGSADAVAALWGKEFLDQVSVYPEVEYGFRHPLTREVAYNSQLADRRVRSHRAVASAIVDLEADQLDERAAAVAQHLELAGENIDAARWHERAGAWSFTRDLTAADNHWRRALDLLADFASDDAERLRLAVTTRLLRTAIRIGSPESDLEPIRAVTRPIAERRQDTYALWALSIQPGLLGTSCGDVSEGMRFMHEAAEHAAASDDEGLRAYGPAGLAMGHLYAGDPLEGLSQLDRLLDATEHDHDLGLEGLVGLRVRGWAQAHRALGLALVGRLEDASDAVVSALRSSADEPLTPIFARISGCLAGWFTGEADPALAYGRDAVRASVEWGASMWANFARVALGAALLVDGRYDSALEVLDVALDEMRARRLFAVMDGTALALAARAAAALDDRDRAFAAAEEAVQVSTTTERLFSQPWAYLARAHVVRRFDGPLDDVLDDLVLAERVIAATGQVAHQPFVHLERGEPALAAELFGGMGATRRAASLHALS